jgi:hypothetical protein
VGFFEREEGTSGLPNRGDGVSSRIVHSERREAVLAYGITSLDGLPTGVEGGGEIAEWQWEREGEAIRKRVTHRVAEKLGKYRVCSTGFVTLLIIIGAWAQWLH